jgi:hypothetical protein
MAKVCHRPLTETALGPFDE